MSEQVLVIECVAIAQWQIEHGLTREVGVDLLTTIAGQHFFIDRTTAERSPEFKQIIPYVLLRHGDSWYLLQRTPKQTEARLHHKLSLGIGGHINPDTPDLLDGLQKELEEEVNVEGDYELTFAGILNDDTTEVGRVHLGVVFILVADEPTVSVRETEKMSGRWVPAAELAQHRDAMESWSQIVFDELLAKPGA
jgi:predicted NUDIX family phosphoesterase